MKTTADNNKGFDRKSSNGNGRRPAKKRALTSAQRKEVIALNKQVTRSMAEKKYFDVNADLAIASTSPTSNGVFVCLSEPTAGTGDTSRIGDSIRLTSLQVKLHATVGGAGSVDAYILRVILFHWLVNDDVDTPGIAEILQTQSSNQSVLSPLTHDTRKLRKIIDDRVLRAYDDGGSTSWESPIYFENVYFFKNPKNKVNEIQYIGSTVRGINNVYMLLVTNNNATGNGWNVSYHTRINYIDM